MADEIPRQDLRLEWVDPMTLDPNPSNWRVHPKPQRDGMASVLRKVGWAGVCFLNECREADGWPPGTTPRLIDGHLRRDVSAGPVPVIRGGSWSPDDEALILVTLDPLAMMADAAEDRLVPLLDRVDAGDDDGLAGILDALMADVGIEKPNTKTGEDPGSQIDRGAELREKWGTAVGQLWKLGRHGLFCGDALAPESIEAVLPNDKKANLIFTDPPYNVDIARKSRGREMAGDHQSAESWIEFCARVAAVLRSIAAGCVYVCHAPGQDGRAMALALDGTLHPSTTIIWRKNAFTLGRGKYQSQYEPIWFGWGTYTPDYEPIWFGWSRGGTSDFESRSRKLTNVWDIPRPKRSPDHPTTKPLELVETAIEHASGENAIVADLFVGSGTTLIASERLGRRCRAIEILPEFVAATLERWATMTGETPEKLRDGV